VSPAPFPSKAPSSAPSSFHLFSPQTARSLLLPFLNLTLSQQAHYKHLLVSLLPCKHHYPQQNQPVLPQTSTLCNYFLNPTRSNTNRIFFAMYMLKTVVSVALFTAYAAAQAAGVLAFTSVPTSVQAGETYVLTWAGGDSTAVRAQN
jgi:hypothetical protein